jgi:pentatricopeptide repeat protein
MLFTVFLSAFGKAKMKGDLHKVYKDMQQAGVKPDPMIISILLPHSGPSKRDELIKELRTQVPHLSVPQLTVAIG